MAERRNVLLIVVDQWRGDCLPVLGHPCLKTPNIDALCAEGVTFRNHYTQAVPCGPGRASLLTGMYMMNHRAVQNTIPLDARHSNLALETRKLGYDPVLVGYTTTTPDPRTAAFDDPRFTVLGDLMDGWRPVGAFEPRKEGYFGWVKHQGFDVPPIPDDIWLPRDHAPGEVGAVRKPSLIPAELSDTTWFTERGLAYLKGHGELPWLLHLGYYRPHPPFIAPAPYHEMYDPGEVPAPVRGPYWTAEAEQHPLLDYYLQNNKRKSFFQNGEGLTAEMSEAEVRDMRTAYYGMISEIDDQLGRVFDYLKETGQWDDTLIVFTCDHGEQLGDHYLLGKMGYFSQSFHIPMIVRDPHREADASRGRIVSQFTETIDCMPTILEWLGAPVPRQVDGRSLLPFCHGETPADWRTEVHYEFDYRDLFYTTPESWLGLKMDDCGLTVIQDEAFKYVHFTDLPPLFFDLAEDPEEFVNVAGEPEYQADLLRYAQKMLSWRMRYAERTLTHYAASPEGLRVRA